MRRKLALTAAVIIAAFSATQRAMAWGHQGHILITRMACLRIINDPAAPEGLKKFLSANMKSDIDACKKLATEEMVGSDPKNYLAGIDGAATWPDRVQQMDEGKELIAPYGAPEGKMHFMDMEFFGKEWAYKPDLSNRPEIKDVVKDLKDPRWKDAGYVPFRVEEFYGKLVKDLGNKDLDNDAAVKNLGYMVHYIEDCTQPHHGTIDYKSFSYLMGKVKQVHEVTKKTAVEQKEFKDYTVASSLSRKFNPHGDLEFQLFENADEPRKTYRAEFWETLNKEIEAQAQEVKKSREPAFDGFTKALTLLRSGYEYLPAIGEAAIAAYAGDSFDAKVYFTTEVTFNGKKIKIIDIIAHQNARAVLEVEAAIRHAWADANP